MTAPDFELAVGLSAGELRTHVTPDARVQPTGRCVAVERWETRIGISAKAEAGGCYRNVVVEKRLAAMARCGSDVNRSLPVGHAP